MSDDGMVTASYPGEQVYRDAAMAVAAVEDWSHDPRLASLLDYPPFRAAVESAFAAGWRAGQALVVVEDEPIRHFLDERDIAAVEACAEEVDRG